IALDQLDRAAVAPGAKPEHQRQGRRVRVVDLSRDLGLASLMQHSERPAEQRPGQPAVAIVALDSDQAKPGLTRAVPHSRQPDVADGSRVAGDWVSRGIEGWLVVWLLAEVTRIPLPACRSGHVLAQRVIEQPQLVLVCVSG